MHPERLLGDEPMQIFAEHLEQGFHLTEGKSASIACFDPLDVTFHEVPPKTLGHLALRKTELVS